MYSRTPCVCPYGPKVCLKIHSRHLRAPLRGIFGPNSVNVARYASLIGTKSPTKWDAQLTESNFQTDPSILFFEYRGFPWLWEDTDTLGALLRGESVLIRGSLFEDRLYSDTALPGWNYVFSDSCLEKPDTSYEGTWITAYGFAMEIYIKAKSTGTGRYLEAEIVVN